jgi:hypothetical protein
VKFVYDSEAYFTGVPSLFSLPFSPSSFLVRLPSFRTHSILSPSYPLNFCSSLQPKTQHFSFALCHPTSVLCLFPFQLSAFFRPPSSVICPLTSVLRHPSSDFRHPPSALAPAPTNYLSSGTNPLITSSISSASRFLSKAFTRSLNFAVHKVTKVPTSPITSNFIGVEAIPLGSALLLNHHLLNRPWCTFLNYLAAPSQNWMPFKLSRTRKSTNMNPR